VNSHKLNNLSLLNAVCKKVLEATSSLISATEVQLDLLLHFLSTIPREFTDISGIHRIFFY
jgi:tRNA guanosine-2'-O-methyltransferase